MEPETLEVAAAGTIQMMIAPVLGGAMVALLLVLAIRIGRRFGPSPARREAPPEEGVTDDGPALVPAGMPGEGGSDTFDRMLKERIIFLGTTISDEVATVVIAQLLFLEAEDRHVPITFYLDSPGGDIVEAFAIRDTMSSIAPPVHTIVMGQAAGAALMLAAHGARGQRRAWRGARLTLTPLAVVAEPVDVAALARVTAVISAFLAADTGQSEATIARDTEQTRWFTAEQARTYGLIDDVIVGRGHHRTGAPPKRRLAN